ncbi:hypothetical protein VKA52_18000 [Halobacillus sp. HZG1]|uniref:hypothetical protein n=1 Tax=Halobacillus sp. HZG1 TaxID=3111769 RepID=UPI002DBB05A0|nr:hypothetical protein [Halobacillus sp. HZG1]MEC3885618.1 hypothetical protein [Halobacillus sp. HZG1]
MNPMTIHVKQQKKDVALLPSRVVFYEQMQLVETFNDQSECHMLFFYKQKYLTAVKTTRLKLHSYVARAFKEGTVYESPHPFIHALIEMNHPLQKISYPQLKKNIARPYSRQEQAKILTFFESFIPKKQLFQDIKSLFYQYRREGNMSGAYRVIRVMRDFAPNNRFVKEMANDLSYREHANQYLEQSHELMERDPLFKETCASFEDHQRLLEKENRWVEATSYLFADFYNQPTSESYQLCRSSFSRYFDNDSRTFLLEQMAQAVPSFESVTEDLFQHYLVNENVHAAAQLYIERDLQLDEAQFNQLKALLEKNRFAEDPENLLPLMKRITDEQPGQSKDLLDAFVIRLLQTQELVQVHESLKSFPNKSSLMKKVERMNDICEDLDCMQELGELYYEFHQLEKSIECFQMEMELKPSTPEPLRWLSKVYADKQMMDESKAYQQLCVDVQKWA